MVPFRGIYDHTLDAKNRLTVPSRYRGALSEGAVLALPLDQQPCLGLWLPDRYAEYTERALAGLPPLSTKLSEMERFFFSGSQEVELDAAGRIMIPSTMREEAGIAKEVVVVGAGHRLEIWDRTRWAEHRPSLMQSVSEVTAGVDSAA